MSSPPRPRLLVTRPADRQEPFGRRARALGVDTLPFPCLEIRPEPDARLPAPATLAAFDAVLFTSRPAVEAASRLRPFPWPGVAVLAIGAATAEALARLGQPLAREPAPPFTSEALLARLAEVPPPASLLVVKGHGGRDAVERGLGERGTRVETLALYRRARPAPSPEACRRTFVETPPDIVSATSDEGLINLVALAAESTAGPVAKSAAGPAAGFAEGSDGGAGGTPVAMLLSRPLIVNSERAAASARALGFEGAVRVARPAGDAGQLAELAAWLEERRTRRVRPRG